MVDIPYSENGVPLPAVSLKKGAGAHSIAATASSARNSTAFLSSTIILSVYATENVFIEFGNDAVTASSSNHFFPKGMYYDFHLPRGTTHLAVISDGTDGTVYISEKV